jgi:hypothetical protein
MRLLAVQRPCLTRLSEMKVFAGLVTNDQPAVRQMISQRMASGQTHVNITGLTDGSRLITFLKTILKGFDPGSE